MSQFLKSISQRFLASTGMVAEAAPGGQGSQARRAPTGAAPLSPDDPLNLQNRNSLMYKRHSWFYHKMLKNQVMDYDNIDGMARNTTRVDVSRGITLNLDRTLQTPTHMMKGAISLTAFGGKKNKGQGQDDEPTHPLACSGEVYYFIENSSIMGSIDDEHFQARGHIQLPMLSYSAMMNASHTGENDMILHALNTGFGNIPVTAKHQISPHGSVTILGTATAFDSYNLGLECVHVHENTSYWGWKFGSKLFADPKFTLEGELAAPPTPTGEWTFGGNTNGELNLSGMLSLGEDNGIGAEADYNLGSGELSWKVAASLDVGNGYDLDISYDNEMNLNCAVDTTFWGIPSLSVGLSGSIGPDLSLKTGLELNYNVTSYEFPVEQV